MIELLIADGLIGATQFSRQMGWRQTGAQTFVRGTAPAGEGIVHYIAFEEQMAGLKKAVLHVGPFTNLPESRARRRHLISIAENRGIHVIPYDTSISPPEPMRMCLICGSTTPCMWREDLQPGEPGVPCTFDMTYNQLFHELRKVKKENVQLREQFTAIESAVEQIQGRIEQTQRQLDELRQQLKAYRRPEPEPHVAHRRAGS